MDLAARKRDLRRRLAALRAAVDPGSGRAASIAVADAVVETAEFREAPVVALYAALAGELPTEELFVRARAASKRCLFPRCVGRTTLEFVAIDRWEALAPPGRFGLCEPPLGLAAEELDADALVIVPGLAFDLAGNRLGHGRGYYDRRFPVGRDGAPRLFGVGFSWQLVEQVPVGQFDRMMDAIVTERGITRPRRSAAKAMRPETGQREEP